MARKPPLPPELQQALLDRTHEIALEHRGWGRRKVEAQVKAEFGASLRHTATLDIMREARGYTTPPTPPRSGRPKTPAKPPPIEERAGQLAATTTQGRRPIQAQLRTEYGKGLRWSELDSIISRVRARPERVSTGPRVVSRQTYTAHETEGELQPNSQQRRINRVVFSPPRAGQWGIVESRLPSAGFERLRLYQHAFHPPLPLRSNKDIVDAQHAVLGHLGGGLWDSHRPPYKGTRYYVTLFFVGPDGDEYPMSTRRYVFEEWTDLLAEAQSIITDQRGRGGRGRLWTSGGKRQPSKQPQQAMAYLVRMELGVYQAAKSKSAA